MGTEREPGLRCSPAWVSSSRERRIGKRFRAEVDYGLFYERELVGSSWAFEFQLDAKTAHEALLEILAHIWNFSIYVG